MGFIQFRIVCSIALHTLHTAVRSFLTSSIDRMYSDSDLQFFIFIFIPAHGSDQVDVVLAVPEENAGIIVSFYSHFTICDPFEQHLS